MITYVAFPRAINVGLSIKMEDLRAIFAGLGFQNIRSVLASGNIIFETNKTDLSKLEDVIERAILETTNYPCTTVVRTAESIKNLVAQDPFNGRADVKPIRLYISFIKQAKQQNERPRSNPSKGYELVAFVDGAVCSTVDFSSSLTPDLMIILDQAYDKQVTTRGWATILRIAKAL